MVALLEVVEGCLAIESTDTLLQLQLLLDVRYSPDRLSGVIAAQVPF